MGNSSVVEENILEYNELSEKKKFGFPFEKCALTPIKLDKRNMEDLLNKPKEELDRIFQF